MKVKYFLPIFIIVTGAVLLFVVYRAIEDNKGELADYKAPLYDQNGFGENLAVYPGKEPTKVNLEVPYINEAPDNDWTGPWKDACEEASITMIEKYY
ncbi:MAG: hypothetical protein WC797_03350, partial [Candidatus Paceibacterota bacterium]